MRIHLIVFFVLCGLQFPVLAQDIPADKAGCKAAGGTWGKYGMAQTETCDLPAPDAGKSCRRNEDCTANLCIEADSAWTFARRGKCFERTVASGCHAVFNAAAGWGQHTAVCFD